MCLCQTGNINCTRVLSSGVGNIYTSGAPEFIPGLSRVRVIRSLVLCVMLCRSLFVLFLLANVLSSFFDLRILITPLVSSNSSYQYVHAVYVVVSSTWYFESELISLHEHLGSNPRWGMGCSSFYFCVLCCVVLCCVVFLFVFILCLVCPMLPVSLDCPLLIVIETFVSALCQPG